MPSLGSILSSARSLFRGASRKGAPSGGGSAYGAGYGGGSIYADAYRSRRAPTPAELVEGYRSLCYALANVNANAVARVPLRLYVTTGTGKTRPKCLTNRLTKGAGLRRKQHVMSRPYVVKGMLGADDLEEVVDPLNPFLRSIREPNPYFDNVTLIRHLVVCLDVVGSAYLVPEKNGMEAIAELWPLMAQYVYPIPDSDGLPRQYIYFGERYEPDQLIRFRHASQRSPYLEGYSPTRAAWEYLKAEDESVGSLTATMENVSRPDVFVMLKDNTAFAGSTESDRAEDRFNARFRGGRKGRAMFIEGAVGVQPAGYPPTDLAAAEIGDFALERAAFCYDIPIGLIRSKDVNKANAETAERIHAKGAVQPRCELIGSGLTQWTHRQDPTGKQGFSRYIWAFDDPVGSDEERDANVSKIYVDMGAKTRAEVRSDQGWEEIEGADELLVPGTLKTLDQIANPPLAEGEAKDGESPTTPEGAALSADVDVQATALNGAQIASLLQAVEMVANNQLPSGTAEGVIAASFPMLSPEQISAILKPLANFEPPPPPAPAMGAFGKPPGIGGPPKPKPDDAAKDEEKAIRERMVKVLDAMELSLKGEE